METKYKLPGTGKELQPCHVLLCNAIILHTVLKAFPSTRKGTWDRVFKTNREKKNRNYKGGRENKQQMYRYTKAHWTRRCPMAIDQQQPIKKSSPTTLPNDQLWSNGLRVNPAQKFRQRQLQFLHICLL